MIYMIGGQRLHGEAFYVCAESETGELRLTTNTAATQYSTVVVAW